MIIILFHRKRYDNGIVSRDQDIALENSIDILTKKYPDDHLIEFKLAEERKLAEDFSDKGLSDRRSFLLDSGGKCVLEYGSLPTRLSFVGHSGDNFFVPFRSPTDFVDTILYHIKEAIKINPRIVDTLKTIDLISCTVGLTRVNTKSFAEQTADLFAEKGFTIKINAITNKLLQHEQASDLKVAVHPVTIHSAGGFTFETNIKDAKGIFKSPPISEIRQCLDQRSSCHFFSKNEIKPASAFVNFCNAILNHLDEALTQKNISDTILLDKQSILIAQETLKTIKSQPYLLEEGLDVVKTWLANFKSRYDNRDLFNLINGVISAAERNLQKNSYRFK